MFSENKNVQKILDFAAKKGFAVDDRFPAEREFAKELGISRNALREALKILQTLGVIEVRSNSGVYLQESDFRMLEKDASVWLMIHKKEIFEILTVREALDLCAIDLIPESMYPEIRNQLKATIEKARGSVVRNQALMEHDLEFHNIIRKASGNEIILNICTVFTGTIYDERRALFMNESRVEKSLQEHNRIANAFGSGDVNEIKLAYTAHLASTRQSIENT